MKFLLKYYFTFRVAKIAKSQNIPLDMVARRRIAMYCYSVHTRVELQERGIRITSPLGQGVEDVLIIYESGESAWDLYFP